MANGETDIFVNKIFANQSARLHYTKMASTSKHKLGSSSCGPRPSRTWSICEIRENYCLQKLYKNFAMYSSLRRTVVILTSGTVKNNNSTERANISQQVNHDTNKPIDCASWYTHILSNGQKRPHTYLFAP